VRYLGNILGGGFPRGTSSKVIFALLAVRVGVHGPWRGTWGGLLG
jgi:hypothetical protein